MRQIIEIVKAIKGKKYIIASWCIIIINGLLPDWIWAYCAKLIHCDITDYFQHVMFGIVLILCIFIYTRIYRVQGKNNSFAYLDYY